MSRASYLALIFFGLLAYCNAIRHPFVHDDVVFILKNPHITELDHWYEAFKVPSLSGGINTYYRPVLEVLYRLEYRFFGEVPYGYHLFNCLVHIANGLLLFGLLQRLNITTRLAWVIALLFLIHPVQTEAVSCIAGISNLWMALGVLLALYAYLNRWYTASLVCFTVAFLSKEQAVMFVPLVMVIDYTRGEKDYRPWFLVGLAALILLWLRQVVTGASLLHDIMVSPGEFYLRLAAIPRDIGLYLRLIFFPYDLHYYRNTDILQSNTSSWGLAMISVAGIFYILKRNPKARPMMILGVGWFLAALFPVLNIASLINEYSFILTPEHFLYLPIVGILIIAIAAADYFMKDHKKALLGIIVSGCLLMTWHQNTFWRSETVLFERMLRFEPDFGRGHLLLAQNYYFNGRPQDADGHYAKAFMIMSGYAKKASNITAQKYYLGIEKEILFDWAQNDCAMGFWASGLQKYKQATVLDAKDASLFNNMAFVYMHLGDKKDAYLSLEQAVRVDPSFAQARRNLQILGGP
jgi:tetratricopeptide (TPR) repeat protein